jgi:hypothetical protein
MNVKVTLGIFSDLIAERSQAIVKTVHYDAVIASGAITLGRNSTPATFKFFKEIPDTKWWRLTTVTAASTAAQRFQRFDLFDERRKLFGS